ncbi:MAG: DsrE family protein [Zoogloea sp.]|uniref:DsrE family protein n=1 Tax=Zoogloea sp. TaxID=49181 RepID=UPI00260DB4C9|nr:DsrE family protein [Zoogloea sp.]MDD2988686.1 DsrE family protein [Zoogloea sp.]
MTRSFRRTLFALSLAAGALASQSTAYAVAPEPNDAMALRGVSEGKGVFLIDFSNPRKTAFYLSIIKRTHQGLGRQGVKPDLILVYIGETVRYLSSRPDPKLLVEHEDALEAVAILVRELAAMGVRQEVCAIATQVMGVDNASLHEGLSVVADGFISLIGYQTQGYKLVPIF